MENSLSKCLWNPCVCLYRGGCLRKEGLSVLSVVLQRGQLIFFSFSFQ